MNLGSNVTYLFQYSAPGPAHGPTQQKCAA